jgi:hypothetical protein
MDIRKLQGYKLICPKNPNRRRPAMSDITIAPYYPFRLIKIVNQSVDADATTASIEIEPKKTSSLYAIDVGTKRTQCTVGLNARFVI